MGQTIGDLVGPGAIALADRIIDVTSELLNSGDADPGDVYKALAAVLATLAMTLYVRAGVPNPDDYARDVFRRVLETVMLPVLIHEHNAEHNGEGV